MRRIFLALAIALLTACSAGSQHQDHTLPNGKVIKLIGITKMFSTNGKNKWLVLNYQTELPMSDKSALGKEADEIWVFFKNDVEKAGMTEAAIVAHSRPTGFIIQESKTQGFSYEKRTDGGWSRDGS
jgi:hypothetical protein